MEVGLNLPVMLDQDLRWNSQVGFGRVQHDLGNFSLRLKTFQNNGYFAVGKT